MSVDTGQLTMLQRKLASNALETCPDSVSKFVIVATEGGNSMSYNVQAKPPFMLNEEAEAALKEIFVLYKSSGDALRQLTCEFAEKPDQTWGMSMEYEYLEP